MKDGNEAQGGNNNLDDKGTSQEAFNQIADDIYACLDKWPDAGIDNLFALSVSLDILAQFCRDTLPADFAEELIQDAVGPHEDDV